MLGEPELVVGRRDGQLMTFFLMAAPGTVIRDPGVEDGVLVSVAMK
jgi:hypothetical protein